MPYFFIFVCDIINHCGFCGILPKYDVYLKWSLVQPLDLMVGRQNGWSCHISLAFMCDWGILVEVMVFEWLLSSCWRDVILVKLVVYYDLGRKQEITCGIRDNRCNACIIYNILKLIEYQLLFLEALKFIHLKYCQSRHPFLFKLPKFFSCLLSPSVFSRYIFLFSDPTTSSSLSYPLFYSFFFSLHTLLLFSPLSSFCYLLRLPIPQ